MDSSILDNKIYELEKRIDKLEQEKNDEGDDNSLISLILDIFSVKRLLEMILYSQKRIKMTKNFINVVLLFIFLIFIFWETGSLKIEISPVTVTLGSILLIGLAEIANENRWILKDKFTREVRIKKFFDNLNSMKKKDIESEIKTQRFSSNCINYLFRKIEKDKSNYPLYLMDLVIENQYLDQNNLNLLFTSQFLKDINENTIKKLLIYKKERLTPQNIRILYEAFKDQDDIVKILVASQYSNLLVKESYEDKRLITYYEDYYAGKKHLNWELKILNFLLPKINSIKGFSEKLIFIFFFIYYIKTEFILSTTLYNISQITSFLLASAFITLIVCFVLFGLPYNFLTKKYINTYINNIINFKRS